MKQRDGDTTQRSDRDVIVAITLAADTRRDVHAIELSYAGGNIDIVTDDASLRLGPFDGAVLVLPTLENLAERLAALRGGDGEGEVVVVGDEADLTLARAGDGLRLSHRRRAFGPVSWARFDDAVGAAVYEVVAELLDARAWETWDPASRKMVTRCAAVWPALSALIPRRSR